MTDSNSDTPVLIAGGGPIGMLLALELAKHEISSILVERNETTTDYPKMDLTNGRSMELFRRLGIVDEARAVGVPEDKPINFVYPTCASGHHLHTFNNGTPAEYRQRSLDTNDGTLTLEPPMRVSQIEIEPVFKQAIDDCPLVDVRFGHAFEGFVQDDAGVTSTISAAGESYDIRSQFLAGCDGGGSLVRKLAGIELEGNFGDLSLYMIHFHSNDRDVLARFGEAYHTRTPLGTVIAQNDADVWTLHVVLTPDLDPDVDPGYLLERYAGTKFDYEILVANPWTPHHVVAEQFRNGRVFLAGDAAHQFIPAGGYGMNTGTWDAADLGWKLGAVINGWGGDALLDSVDERRHIAIQNRSAAISNIEGRWGAVQAIETRSAETDIEADDAESVRAQIAEDIAQNGNAENTRWGIEHGYFYKDSIVIAYPEDRSGEPVFDSMRVQPSVWPGAHLPHFFLADGKALYDQLGEEFTVICLDDADSSTLEAAASDMAIPLSRLHIAGDENLSSFGTSIILVRPDRHIAWSCNSLPEDCSALLKKVVGRA